MIDWFELDNRFHTDGSGLQRLYPPPDDEGFELGDAFVFDAGAGVVRLDLDTDREVLALSGPSPGDVVFWAGDAGAKALVDVVKAKVESVRIGAVMTSPYRWGWVKPNGATVIADALTAAGIAVTGVAGRAGFVANKSCGVAASCILEVRHELRPSIHLSLPWAEATLYHSGFMESWVMDVAWDSDAWRWGKYLGVDEPGSVAGRQAVPEAVAEDAVRLLSRGAEGFLDEVARPFAQVRANGSVEQVADAWMGMLGLGSHVRGIVVDVVDAATIEDADAEGHGDPFVLFASDGVTQAGSDLAADAGVIVFGIDGGSGRLRSWSPLAEAAFPVVVGGPHGPALSSSERDRPQPFTSVWHDGIELISAEEFDHWRSLFLEFVERVESQHGRGHLGDIDAMDEEMLRSNVLGYRRQIVAMA